MTISLKIDNFDALPDGGPLSYQAHRRGFEIGREHRDWTLPDPNMFISGRHCEVRFEKGGYWLYDVSRNGTFVNGSQPARQEPVSAADGDRLQIGHYLVVRVGRRRAQCRGRREAFAVSGSAEQQPTISGTPAQPAPPPINRRDLMPPQKRGQRSADFAERHLELPPVVLGSLSTTSPAPRGRSRRAAGRSVRAGGRESPLAKPAPGAGIAGNTPVRPTPARRPCATPVPFESFGGRAVRAALPSAGRRRRRSRSPLDRRRSAAAGSAGAGQAGGGGDPARHRGGRRRVAQRLPAARPVGRRGRDRRGAAHGGGRAGDPAQGARRGQADGQERQPHHDQRRRQQSAEVRAAARGGARDHVHAAPRRLSRRQAAASTRPSTT